MNDKDCLFKQYHNNKLWAEICDRSISGAGVIEVIVLRKILEDFRILGDEKDGM